MPKGYNIRKCKRKNKSKGKFERGKDSDKSSDEESQEDSDKRNASGSNESGSGSEAGARSSSNSSETESEEPCGPKGKKSVTSQENNEPRTNGKPQTKVVQGDRSEEYKRFSLESLKVEGTWSLEPDMSYRVNQLLKTYSKDKVKRKSIL